MFVFSVEMRLSGQILFLGCSAVFAKQDVVKSGVNHIKDVIKEVALTLTVDEAHVKGVVDAPINFTVSFVGADWVADELEVCYGYANACSRLSSSCRCSGSPLATLLFQGIPLGRR